jgi:hypothetical protein
LPPTTVDGWDWAVRHPPGYRGAPVHIVDAAGCTRGPAPGAGRGPYNVRAMPTVGVPPSRRMLCPLRLWLVGLLTAAAAVRLPAQAPAPAPTPIAVTVAYDNSGGCQITATGHPVRAVSPIPWRCDLAGLPAKTGVALTVTIPPGVTPSDASFPRMRWAPDGEGHRGSAVLPAAPAFVNVAIAGGADALRSRWLDLLALGATALAAAASLVYGRRA